MKDNSHKDELRKEAQNEPEEVFKSEHYDEIKDPDSLTSHLDTPRVVSPGSVTGTPAVPDTGSVRARSKTPLAQETGTNLDRHPTSEQGRVDADGRVEARSSVRHNDGSELTGGDTTDREAEYDAVHHDSSAPDYRDEQYQPRS